MARWATADVIENKAVSTLRAFRALATPGASWCPEVRWYY